MWSACSRACATRGGRTWPRVVLDGTVVRAHHKAAGAPKKGGPARERDRREALGRSRGGFGTEACAACDAAGRPLAFALLPG